MNGLKFNSSVTHLTPQRGMLLGDYRLTKWLRKYLYIPEAKGSLSCRQVFATDTFSEQRNTLIHINFKI